MAKIGTERPPHKGENKGGSDSSPFPMGIRNVFNLNVMLGRRDILYHLASIVKEITGKYSSKLNMKKQ